MDRTVAISSSFLDSLAALPRKAQGEIAKFANRFKLDPRDPKLTYEKIKPSADDKFFSIPIGDDLLAVVARDESCGVHLLLWVDSPGQALECARGRRCEVNPKTGGLQLFEVGA